jgi:hypothetical protein
MVTCVAGDSITLNDAGRFDSRQVENKEDEGAVGKWNDQGQSTLVKSLTTTETLHFGRISFSTIMLVFAGGQLSLPPRKLLFLPL